MHPGCFPNIPYLLIYLPGLGGFGQSRLKSGVTAHEQLAGEERKTGGSSRQEELRTTLNKRKIININIDHSHLLYI